MVVTHHRTNTSRSEHLITYIIHNQWQEYIYFIITIRGIQQLWLYRENNIITRTRIIIYADFQARVPRL